MATRIERRTGSMFTHQGSDGQRKGSYPGTQMKAAQSTVQIWDEQYLTAVVSLLPGEKIYHETIE